MKPLRCFFLLKDLMAICLVAALAKSLVACQPKPELTPVPATYPRVKILTLPRTPKSFTVSWGQPTEPTSPGVIDPQPRPKPTDF